MWHYVVLYGATVPQITTKIIYLFDTADVNDVEVPYSLCIYIQIFRVFPCWKPDVPISSFLNQFLTVNLNLKFKSGKVTESVSWPMATQEQNSAKQVIHYVFCEFKVVIWESAKCMCIRYTYTLIENEWKAVRSHWANGVGVSCSLRISGDWEWSWVQFPVRPFLLRLNILSPIVIIQANHTKISWKGLAVKINTCNTTNNYRYQIVSQCQCLFSPASLLRTRAFSGLSLSIPQNTSCSTWSLK